MERNGWICRHDCPTDRRKKIIRTTPEAEPVWEKVLSCAQSVRARAAKGLTDAERLKLIDLLRRVRQNLSAEAHRAAAVENPLEKPPFDEAVAMPSRVNS
jgi:DNA-binding MarR family transcriptional regulator